MTERQEMILLAIGMVILALMILYRAASTQDFKISSAPQTAVETQTETARSRYAVDINRATFDELMGVKGMTEAIANGILAYRNETGRFYTYEELLKVPGVGEKTLEKLLPYIRIDE